MDITKFKDEKHSTTYFPIKNIYCRVFFYNYLFNNYNIENLQLRVAFYSLKGNLLIENILNVKDNETIIFDSKEIAKKYNFNSDVILEFSIPNILPEVKGITRSFADYYSDNGLITCVHDEGSFWSSKFSGSMAQGNMNALCTKDITTFAIVQNTSPLMKAIKIKVRVYNHTGAYKDIFRSSLNFREMQIIDIDPNYELIDFLENKIGNIVIIYSEYVGRVACLQRSRNINELKHISVSHGTYYNLDELRGHQEKDYSSLNYNMLYFILFYNIDGLYTKFTFYNDYPEIAYYSLEIFDKYGNLTKTVDNIFILEQNCVKVIDKNIFSKYIDDKFLGIAKFKIRFKNGCPVYSDTTYELENDVGILSYSSAGMVNLNNNETIKYYEEENLKNTKLLRGSCDRSRQFGRAYICHDIYKSYLLISFSTTNDIPNKQNCNIKLIFTSQDSLRTITKYLELPINGILYKDLDLFLGEKHPFIQGEIISIYLREPNFKVHANVLLKNKKTNDIGMDHFVGG